MQKKPFIENHKKFDDIHRTKTHEYDTDFLSFDNLVLEQDK